MHCRLNLQLKCIDLYNQRVASYQQTVSHKTSLDTQHNIYLEIPAKPVKHILLSSQQQLENEQHFISLHLFSYQDVSVILIDSKTVY